MSCALLRSNKRASDREPAFYTNLTRDALGKKAFDFSETCGQRMEMEPMRTSGWRICSPDLAKGPSSGSLHYKTDQVSPPPTHPCPTSTNLVTDEAISASNVVGRKTNDRGENGIAAFGAGWPPTDKGISGHPWDRHRIVRHVGRCLRLDRQCA